MGGVYTECVAEREGQLDSFQEGVADRIYSKNHNLPPQYSGVMCSVSGMPQRALKLTVLFFVMGNMPRMTADEYEEVLYRICTQYSADSTDEGAEPPREPFKERAEGGAFDLGEHELL